MKGDVAIGGVELLTELELRAPKGQRRLYSVLDSLRTFHGELELEAIHPGGSLEALLLTRRC